VGVQVGDGAATVALPAPGVESTVADLDATNLYRAARASIEVLATVSAAAARRHPAELPTAMAAYVTRVLSETNGDRATAKAHLQFRSWTVTTPGGSPPRDRAEVRR